MKEYVGKFWVYKDGGKYWFNDGKKKPVGPWTTQRDAELGFKIFLIAFNLEDQVKDLVKEANILHKIRKAMGIDRTGYGI